VQALLEAARGDRLEALYVLALSTGLREGELLGLCWADVDPGRGLLRVRQQLSRTRDGLTFSQPKTDKSRRSVRLTPAAVEALARHRERQLQERSKMDGLARPTLSPDPTSPAVKLGLAHPHLWACSHLPG
jgi:integrase